MRNLLLVHNESYFLPESEFIELFSPSLPWFAPRLCLILQKKVILHNGILQSCQIATLSRNFLFALENSTILRPSRPFATS